MDETKCKIVKKNYIAIFSSEHVPYFRGGAGGESGQKYGTCLEGQIKSIILTQKKYSSSFTTPLTFIQHKREMSLELLFESVS